MEKTAIELFAGVGGFRCGLNHVELKDGKVVEKEIGSFYGLTNGNLLLKVRKLMNVMLKDLVKILYLMLISLKLISMIFQTILYWLADFLAKTIP